MECLAPVPSSKRTCSESRVPQQKGVGEILHEAVVIQGLIQNLLKISKSLFIKCQQEIAMTRVGCCDRS